MLVSKLLNGKLFSEVVRGMTFKEIAQAMVDGLKDPSVVIDLSSYGYETDGVCYGCAATNAICKISGVRFTPETIYERVGVLLDTTRVETRQDEEIFYKEKFFLSRFEYAINELRLGNTSQESGYNFFAALIDIAPAPENWTPGPELLGEYPRNTYPSEELHKLLAEWQKAIDLL